MTLTREQLLHLADRARRGVALPTEHDQLTAGITDMAARIVTLEAVCESNKRAYKGAVQAAWAAEATVDRVRARVDRLEEFAENALKTDDRQLYTAIANDLRAALDQAQQPTTEARCRRGPYADCPACHTQQQPTT